MQPQIHGFLYRDTINGNYGHGLREPTNEEIQVQAMLSIAHGADGICWFIYNSHIWKTEITQKPTSSMMGLLSPEDDISRRIVNCYGQNKWQYVSDMNAKINKWIPVLENTDWIGGYSVHSEGAGHYYISNIISMYKAPDNEFKEDPQCIYCDKENERYWEMGFFN